MMEVLDSLDAFTRRTGAVLSLGMFDGVHTAHREVLRTLSAKARETGSAAVVITFHPHPRALLSGQPFPLIVTQEEKKGLLERQQTDIWCRLAFTRELAATTPEALLELLDSKLKINHIVLGYNHNFGAGKSGGIHTLNLLRSRYGFGITEIPRMLSEGREVSSSAIRTALREGDLRTASRLLGYPYFAQVRLLDRPDSRTLRVTVPPEKLLPAPGTYDGLWGQQPTRIEIMDHNQMLLIFGQPAPDAPPTQPHPLYWSNL